MFPYDNKVIKRTLQNGVVQLLANLLNKVIERIMTSGVVEGVNVIG